MRPSGNLPEGPRGHRTRRLGHLVLFVLLAGTAFALSVTRVAEHDVPWLLRAGDYALAHHALPARDPFSFASDRPWLHHEWLTEIVLAASYRAGGFLALGLLQGALAVAALLILWTCTPRAGASVWALAVAAAGLRDLLAPRAELFSLVLFAAFLALALRDLGRTGRSPRDVPGQRHDRLLVRVSENTQGDGRALWAALPLQLLWTQLHGGNPFGVAVLGAAAVAGGRRELPRRGAIAAAAAVLTCAGPYGARVHGHFLSAGSALTLIHEWQPLWRLPVGLPQIALALLVPLAALGVVHEARRGARSVARFQLLVAGACVALALLHARFLFEAIAATVPPAATALAELRLPRRAALAAAPALAVALCVPLGRARAGVGLDPTRFPERAVAFLQRTRPPGPMFNSYNFGGYLLFAYPEEPVFVDGRAFTVYSRGLLETLAATYREPPRFAALEARYGFRLAVLARTPTTAALSAYLAHRPDWRLAYADLQALIFERTSPPPQNAGTKERNSSTGGTRANAGGVPGAPQIGTVR